jgi:hypothetical protein
LCVLCIISGAGLFWGLLPLWKSKRRYEEEGKNNNEFHFVNLKFDYVSSIFGSALTDSSLSFGLYIRERFFSITLANSIEPFERLIDSVYEKMGIYENVNFVGLN